MNYGVLDESLWARPYPIRRVGGPARLLAPLPKWIKTTKVKSKAKSNKKLSKAKSDKKLESRESRKCGAQLSEMN